MTYPAWICRPCGERYGKPCAGVSTYHVGSKCGWCSRADVAVTEPRDFGYPAHGSKSQMKRWASLREAPETTFAAIGQTGVLR